MKLAAFFTTLLILFAINTSMAQDTSTQNSDIPFSVDGTYWVPKGEFPVDYHRLSKSASGCVLLKFIINESGNVIEPRILKSFPTSELDDVALDGILKYKFKPTKNNLEKNHKKYIRFYLCWKSG